MMHLTPVAVDPVTAYAWHVVNGEVPAGKWQIAACQRHLSDLETAEARGLKWRPELARKVILFARLCKHFKGEWSGQPVVLEPWEEFIVGAIFGWVWISSGMRRFVDAFVELPRGQGKSTLAAIILLYMTFFDGEPGAEGYCYATKKDQARIVFRTARRFVTSSRVLKTHIRAYQHNLHNEETESKVELLGSDSDNQDGLRPQVAIADELHRHKTPDMVEVVESGMGTRRQPLHFRITTAGENPESVYEHQYAITTQVLEGSIDIPEWFGFIAAADPEDDPAAELTWRKANPNYGVSVKPEFLRKELRKAEADPSEWPKFRRLYLGQKVQSADSYLSLEHWDACQRPMPTDEELRAAPCYIGVDLSSRVDITAGVTVWVLPDDVVVWRARLWVPEANIEERRRKDRVPYPQWVTQGWLHTTAGNVIDQTEIRQWVVAQKAAWPLLREVGYDPWNAGEFALRLQDDDDVPAVEVRQGPKTLSEPTKRLKELVLSGRLIHEHSPAMRWMAANLRVRKDANENVAPCKKTSRRGRIDGPVAGIIGMSRALLAPKSKRKPRLYAL